MQKSKLDVMFAFLCFAGNGGVATVLPDLVPWFARRYKEMTDDERIGRVAVKRAGDIPLTMIRNSLVKQAKDGGFDVLVMIDSDNHPDLYLGHRPNAKPFWETSFNFLYDRAVRGVPTVVCAPYCGPPPHPVNGGMENVYVFHASQNESEDGDPNKTGAISFEAYSREHASMMRGIEPIAAGPTGVIMYSTDAFDLMPIHGKTDEEILEDYKAGKLTAARASQLLRMESWFFYEFTDQYQTQKASTEDVTNTREIQLAGIAKHGEPVVFCNWDAWAGHVKPKTVGAPIPLKIEQVSNVFREAVEKNISVSDRVEDIDFTGDEAPSLQSLSGIWKDDEPMNVSDLRGKPENLSLDDESPGFVRPSVAGMRLGRKFENPATSDEDCQAIRKVAQMADARRVLVLGDMTGELAHAVSRPNATVYVFDGDKGKDWNKYGSVDNCRTIMGNAATKCQEMSPQELDIIVSYCWEPLLGEWVENHLKAGGYLVVPCDPNDESVDLAVEAWAEACDGRHMLIDGAHVRVMQKGVGVKTQEEKTEDAAS